MLSSEEVVFRAFCCFFELYCECLITWISFCDTFCDMPEKVSQDDIHVIKHWDANTKTVDGHYEIPVPWSDSTFIPPETRCMAKMPHDALCVRLNAQPEINVMYNKQPDNKTIDTMISSGYAEEVPHAEPPIDRSWYLTHHHHVYSPAKPAKVRIVFDCSVRSRGSSLNDRTYQGPKLTTLLNVVLLCIIYSCVISGDVQATYNQVKVPVGDRYMMRFLWNGRAYRKTSHLFGDSWCANRAVYALRRVTQYEPMHLSDDVISAIRNGLYVDDLLLSYSCPDRALSVWKEVKESLATRGFNVTNFVTYHLMLLASILDAARAKEVKISPEQSATSSSIFDPFCLLSPWLIYGKALLREVTTSKVGL